MVGGSFLTQYIPAGNCQSRWWGSPRETGWVYERAAASDSVDTSSKQPERRNSIQMELERSLILITRPCQGRGCLPRPGAKKAALEGALEWNCWGSQPVATATMLGK